MIIHGIQVSPLTLQVRKQAPAFYSSANPYHNFDHVLQAEWAVGRLLRRCQRYQVLVNSDVTFQAVYLHDAFYAMDPSAYLTIEGAEATSKEQVSALFAHAYLRKLGATSAHAQQVHDCIMATHFAVIPKTAEQIILRAADLSNLAGPYPAFSDNWERLRKEAGVNNTRTWAERVSSFLPLFLWYRLQLTPGYYNRRGASDFHTRAIGNILRKFFEAFGGRDNVRVIAEVGPGQAPLVISRPLRRGEIYIGIDCQEAVLLPGLQLAKARHRQKALPIFMIPGEGKALPLYPRMVDILYFCNVAVRHPEALVPEEAKRVLRANGEIVVVEEYSPEGPPLEGKTAADRFGEICQKLSVGGFTIGEGTLGDSAFTIKAKPRR